MNAIRQARISQWITALLAAAAVLLSSLLLAQRTQDSALYHRSRVFSSIVAQESVGVGEILTDLSGLQVLVKFLGAVTSAYINFELIPVNEANTFAAVYQSLNAEISVDQFSYQRRNLIIDGNADTETGYQSFLETLRSQNYFDSVSGDFYLTTDDDLRFRVICASSYTPTTLPGFGQPD